MKKLLVLSLVLGVASLASAALSPVTTWVDGNVTWTLDLENAKVIGTGTELGAYPGSYLQKTSGVGSIAPAPVSELDGFKDGVYAIAGDLSGIADVSGVYWLPNASQSNDPAVPQSLGVWFEFDVTPAANGDIVVGAFTGTAIENVMQGTIPEPATMALLGLGALILRRKK